MLNCMQVYSGLCDQIMNLITESMHSAPAGVSSMSLVLVDSCMLGMNEGKQDGGPHVRKEFVKFDNVVTRDLQ